MIVALGTAWFFESQATTTVIVVRHADKVDSGGADAPLSARGRARAELLADTLEAVDVVAGVDAIYATPYRRTQQTAAPLADRLGLPIRIADDPDVEALMEGVVDRHKGKIVLMVSHSDLIADMVAELKGSKKVPPIAEDEYTNLYVVSIPWFGKVKTLRLQYGLLLPEVTPPAESAGARSGGGQGQPPG